jgi:hypothetical protein
MATQISKLQYVDAKLGAPTSGQQTTRYIYDTAFPGLGGTKVTFFQNFAGKTQFQTNLTTNKLDSMESMIIKSIYLIVNAGEVGGPNLEGHSNLNIYVGNQCVLKDFNVSFNVAARGLAFDRLHGQFTQDRFIAEVRLLTDIVIPPQVNFKADFEFAQNTAVAESAITLGLKGYGKIFSAGMSF